MLDQRTYPDKSVIKWAGQVVPVKINADKQPKVLQKYKIEALPTIMFIDAKGKVIGQFLGFYPPADFIAQADKILKKKK
jgi:thioredoxin-related protein